MLKIRWSLQVVLAGLFTFNLVLAQAAQAVTRIEVVVYSAPDVRSAAVGRLPAQTPLVVNGRDEFAHWLAIEQGWIQAGSVDLSPETRLIDFPIVAADPLLVPTAVPLTDDPNLQAIIARLETTPLLHNIDTEAVNAIFERGRQVGSRADVFTMVGDSNTTNGDFMRPLGLEANTCELGAYSYLQDSINFFSTPLREGVPNSFANSTSSIAAHKGLGSSAALDSFWATSPLCEGRESPVSCEYRVTMPSIAVIMLGQIDINYAGTTPDVYRSNMEEIVQLSIDSGVVPVLTTLVFLPERDEWAASIEFDGILLDIADQYQIPLINMWRAAQTLPGYGIGPDRSHLSARVGSFCSFTGAEQELGGTLRTLLTLQMLDYLRQHSA